jgi:hypothetical protein
VPSEPGVSGTEAPHTANRPVRHEPRRLDADPQPLGHAADTQWLIVCCRLREGTVNDWKAETVTGGAELAHRDAPGRSIGSERAVSVWALTSASTFATPATVVSFFTSFPAQTSQSMSGTEIVVATGLVF